jgi:short-subunit dehydrogenase
MTSIDSHIGMPNASVYGATKGALLTLAGTLSGDLRQVLIRVSSACVCGSDLHKEVKPEAEPDGTAPTSQLERHRRCNAIDAGFIRGFNAST